MVAGQPAPASLNYLLNFPETNALSREDLSDAEPNLRSNLSFLDGYRKTYQGDRLFRWYQSRAALRYTTPMQVNETRVLLRGITEVRQSRTQNRDDFTSIQVDIQSQQITGGVESAFLYQRALLGGKLLYRKMWYESPVTIIEYPISDEPRQNRFFYDWLEPTFGREMDFRGTGEGYDLAFYTGLPVSSGYVMQLQYGYSATSHHPVLHYTNSSNREELTGLRTLGLPTRITNGLFRFGIRDHRRAINYSVTAFRANADNDLENNPPETEPVMLDFVSLGGVVYEQSGANFRWEYQGFPFWMNTGLGLSRIDGSVEARTPVLGYYDGVFPLSHAVTGEFSGEIFSQRIQGGYAHRIGEFIGAFEAEYTHSQMDISLDGQGELEFNLASEDIEYPVQYEVHLMRFQGEITYTVGPGRLGYLALQLIPVVNRLDENPINLTPEEPARDVSHGGGMEHRIFLELRF
ncbi:MAG: hypothetical protein K9N46_13785 [Candidatus Marinimicrobia bacterium]|nr:hypothetical protein [Candidatus Neomarinimicrobiota bacterium]MCF7829064.1 hypothetical protein [Candidatus Neomarinimicrobiota bacterium]MCF7881799.1 hypothetical protein [Candidatus Neomarinimicrobiota bacterium]